MKFNVPEGKGKSAEFTGNCGMLLPMLKNTEKDFAKWYYEFRESNTCRAPLAEYSPYVVAAELPFPGAD